MSGINLGGTLAAAKFGGADAAVTDAARRAAATDDPKDTADTRPTPASHGGHHREGTVGTPIENVEVQVWDEHLQPLPRGEVGELVIKGPNVMKCYYNNPEATAETIVNGWLRTGDVGMQDEEGYFLIVDRVKDMVNSAGLKIWPREVEEVLYEHAAVAECAVIGVPDPLYGESVKACVVLRAGTAVAAEDLVALCKEKLASYKAPKIVEFLDCLPKNPSGKILKTELRCRADYYLDTRNPTADT